MTIKEKREALLRYCECSDCNTCKLKGDKWEKPLSTKCLDISESPEADLDIALNIIGADTASGNAPIIEDVWPSVDPVNRPAHYTDGKIEVIDFIEDKKLGFCLGNAVKYIARAGKKDPSKEVEDLKKARWYIERRIKEIEESIV